MASDIGPKISIDGEAQYRKQMQNIIQQAKTLESEMRAVTSAFDKNTSAQEKAAAKSDVLNRQIDVQKQKVDQLRAMVEKSAGMYGENATETLKWKQKLNDATASLNKMEKELRDTSEDMDDLGDNTEDSARKMQNLKNKTQGAGQELDSAGKSAGSFGTTLKAILSSQIITAGVQMITDAARAMANALIELGKQSLEAYADYEQLSGGIQSLFSTTTKTYEEFVGDARGSAAAFAEANEEWEKSQAAVSRIMLDADEAFRTASMSRNKYAEAATMFAAPLIDALEGDVAGAADLVNMALVDISDNVNRFGGEQENLLNAYKGFARGQYTLLDNLSLGYAGTAQGMAKLLNDSGVLGDKLIDLTKTNELTAQIEAAGGLPTIIRAIHAKQEELNVAGTTLDEAATTITGSANMVSAAWENVKISMASGDSAMLTQDIDNLVSSVMTLAQNALPRIKEIIGGIGSLVSGLAPTIAQELPVLLGDVLPDLVSSAIKLIEGVLDGVLVALPALLDQLLPMAVELLDTLLVDVLPQVVTVALQLVQTLALGLAEAAPSLIPAAVEAVLMICDGLLGTEGAQLLIDAALALLLGLAEGIKLALPMIAEQAPIIVSELVNALILNLPAIAEAGYKTILALYEGFLPMFPTVWSGILDMCVGIIDTIIGMDWLEIGEHLVLTIAEGALGVATALLTSVENVFSPSTKWIERYIDNAQHWGVDFISGLIKGIRSMIGKLRDAVKDVANTISERLHFSRPEKGELHYYEQWMPHMIEGMVRGVEQNKHKLSNAVAGMAGDVALAAANTTHGGYTTHYGGVNINVYGRDGQSVQELADEVMFRMDNAVHRREAAWT